MNQSELIRIVDGIARDKNIERDQIYNDIEQAVASGLANSSTPRTRRNSPSAWTGPTAPSPPNARAWRCRSRSSGASAPRPSSR